MADEANPKNVSSDYAAQIDYWKMVDAILCGVEAMRRVDISPTTTSAIAGPQQPYASLSQLYRGGMRYPTSPYLPSFPNETSVEYELRRQWAPMTNIYADASRNLAGKPFTKELQLADDTPDDLKLLAENIDGQGNNLHVFARETFKAGIDKAIDWILVDFTKVSAGATLADERAVNARPYWVHIPSERLLAVYSAFFNGQEIITHARIYECTSVQSGYDEVQVERVRVFDRMPSIDTLGKITGYAPAVWMLYEAQTSKDKQGNEETTWVLIDQGDVGIGIIPLVPFITGKRNGTSWQVEPPLKDLAYMQVEDFQQESNLKTIKELTAFPMLSGNGVTPPSNPDGSANTQVPVGPRAVLFAPPSADGTVGEWAYIEPAGSSLTFLRQDLDKLLTEMRNLGMQPLAEANLTVITTANVSMKAHSAVQAWALGLKDALEQAWKITCQWLNRADEPEVNVHTDFGVDFEAGTEVAALTTATQGNLLSKRTYWDELKRRGVLSDEFDPDEEDERLATQQEGLEPEETIDPVMGQPIQRQPQEAA